MIFFAQTTILRRWQRITRSTFHRNYVHVPHLIKPFYESYPVIRRHLLDKIKGQNAKERFGQFLDYQLSYGRHMRSSATLAVYEAMTSPFHLQSEDRLQRIYVLAWISEIIHATALLLDDVIDGSTMRRSIKPWYMDRKDLCSVDAIMAGVAPYILMHSWFAKDATFPSLIYLLNQHVLNTGYQQLMETLRVEIVDSKLIPWEAYKKQCIIKCSYVIDGPFRLAAMEATKSDLSFAKPEQIDDIIGEICYLFQLLNDSVSLLPELKRPQSGKDFDEDIKEKKVDFSITYVMNNATEEDKEIIKVNVGKNDEQCVEAVRNIYKKYDVPNAFRKYRDELIKSIEDKIAEVPNDHRIQEGLSAFLNTMKRYTEFDPTKKKFKTETFS